MRFGSVCSGIEAASQAWNVLGWEAAWLSEIEPFPCAVLKHHYPNVPNYGDMTKFAEWSDEPIDLLCGGTPCQSFSVAGLRKGLDDPRGNLMLTFGAIAAKYRPTWLVWENVPGVLSSNGGRDFGTFFGMLGQLGYGFAYRVLDAQHFGVPQRRKRVFVVGCLGDWRRAAAVLFERHSLSGNPAPSRKAREETATDSQGCVDSGIPQTVGALTDGAHMGGGSTARTHTQVGFLPSVANPLTARMHKGINTTADEKQTPIVTFGGHFDAVPFDTTQITSDKNYSNPKPGDPCHPLASGAHAPAVAIQGNLIGRDAGGPQGVGAAEDVMYTLTKADVHGVAGAMSVRRLTPTECERLQGFPDGYTNIPWRGKPESPDGPRYKALGNSWAVPVVRWIGERIEQVEAIHARQEAA